MRKKRASGRGWGKEKISFCGVILAGLLFLPAQAAGGSEGRGACEAICGMEERCKTLGIPDEGQRVPFCLESCSSPLLNPELRECLAAAGDCEAFSGCMESFSGEAPPAVPSFEPSFLADAGKVPTSPCPGIDGGCTYPDVCCTEIYGSGGHSTKVHVCGERHCPTWCLKGLNPLCLRCGCPEKSDVYPGWPPPPAEDLGLAYNDQHLVLVYKADEPGKRLYVSYSADGTQFSEPYAVPGVTSDYGPALARDDGGLVMAYRGSHDSQRTYVVFTRTGTSFSENIRVHGAHTPRPPAVAFFAGQYQVVVLSHHRSRPFYIVSSTDGEGFEWGKARRIEGHRSHHPPSLAVFQGQLFMAYSSADQVQRVVVARTKDLKTWESTTLETSTPVAPALAPFKGKLYVAFRGPNSGNELMTYSSEDGVEFSGPDTLEHQSSPGPMALAAAPDHLYLGYKANDPTNSLYITSTADGKSWDRKVHLAGDSTP